MRISGEVRQQRKYLTAGMVTAGIAVVLHIILFSIHSETSGILYAVMVQTPCVLVDALSWFLLRLAVRTTAEVDGCRDLLAALDQKRIAFVGAMAIGDRPTEVAVLQSLLQTVEYGAAARARADVKTFDRLMRGLAAITRLGRSKEDQ